MPQRRVENIKNKNLDKEGRINMKTVFSLKFESSPIRIENCKVTQFE